MSSNNNSIQTSQTTVKKFSVNYQIAFNNYVNTIKYYTKYKQMIEEIEKIVFAYKEAIKDFQKKITTLNTNLKKVFFNEEMRCFKYDIFPSTNKYIKYLNNIFNLHISSITNVISELDKNVFRPINKKEETSFINLLQQNKNNLQNDQKRMEKSLNEYDNEHKNLMFMFEDTEENLRKFFMNKRKAKKDSKSKNQNQNTMDKFNNTISNILKVEDKFIRLDENFQNNNSHYFLVYDKYLKELENEVLKNSKYVQDNFILFSSILTNNYENIITKLKEFNEKIKKNKQQQKQEKEDEINEKDGKKEEENEQKGSINESGSQKNEEKTLKEEGETPKKEEENSNTKLGILKKEETEKNEEESKNESKKPNSEFINEDFTVYMSKNLNKFETKYEKEKYKVKAIKETVLDDKLTKETKSIMNDLSSEFGFGYLVEENVIVLADEDVYEITKTFYGPFQYVDKTEYDLVIERKKIDIKNLTNKLLYFGLKGKRDFSDLTEITDEEIKILESGMKKKEYRLTFLQRLNNYRAIGTFEFPQKEFEIIGNFFKLIADYLDEEENKDIESTKFLLILSQTFYIIKDENKKNKEYLLVFIRGHKFFTDKKFWKAYIENSINGEIEKAEKMAKKANAKVKKNYDDICFAHILPFSDNMADLGMPKEILLEIIEPMYEKFNLSEDMKNTMKGVFDSKYQETSCE